MTWISQHTASTTSPSFSVLAWQLGVQSETLWFLQPRVIPVVPSHPRRLPAPKVFPRNDSEEWWTLWTWILFIWELRKDVFSGTPRAKREVLQCLHPGSRSTNISCHRLHWGAWREVIHTFMLSYTLQETRQSFLWKNQQIFLLCWCLRPIESVVWNSVGRRQCGRLNSIGLFCGATNMAHSSVAKEHDVCCRWRGLGQEVTTWVSCVLAITNVNKCQFLQSLEQPFHMTSVGGFLLITWQVRWNVLTWTLCVSGTWLLWQILNPLIQFLPGTLLLLLEKENLVCMFCDWLTASSSGLSDCIYFCQIWTPEVSVTGIVTSGSHAVAVVWRGRSSWLHHQAPMGLRQPLGCHLVFKQQLLVHPHPQRPYLMTLTFPLTAKLPQQPDLATEQPGDLIWSAHSCLYD